MSLAQQVGFAVIVVLYLTVGVMAAAGCTAISRRYLAPRWENVFYGGFLAVIALFYLAFAAYFRADDAWRLETWAVVVFVALGAIGARVPAALIVGYPLHGLWDLLHELQQHGAFAAFGPGQATSLPLGYGLFCAAFDLYVAGYVFLRRSEWSAAWNSPSSAAARAS
jgi:hypothetical protein